MFPYPKLRDQKKAIHVHMAYLKAYTWHKIRLTHGTMWGIHKAQMRNIVHYKAYIWQYIIRHTSGTI